MGLSGSEMDFNKGPNTISLFTNAKYGKIMWLHLVSPGNKQMQVNSQSAATEMGPDAYKGPTAKYEVNKTYHVTLSYDDDTKVLSMTVKDVQSGREIWGYFIQAGERMRGLTRIFVGAKGDYGPQGLYAQGYIDNVRLTVPSAVPVVTETPQYTVPVTTIPATPTKKPTPKITVPTPYPTETPQSPSSGVLPLVALGICGALCYISVKKK
jgi:cell division septation protein DedD